MVTPDKFTIEALFNMRKYTWKPKFSILKRTCRLSGEPIPAFSKAYRGHRVITGPGEAIIIYRWALPDAYLIEKLKGTV